MIVYLTSGDILQINDELTQVFTKYKSIIIEGKLLDKATNQISTTENDLYLLNFDSMSNEKSGFMDTKSEMVDTTKSKVDVLSDLLDTPNIPNANVLKPIQLKTGE